MAISVRIVVVWVVITM